EYNSGTNSWTQKADFGGTARFSAAGFSIGAKGYIGTGLDNPQLGGEKKDFWEYDTTANTWTNKADFAGTARYGARGFSIGTNQWEHKSEFGGTARWGAFSFSIGTKGYIGSGTPDVANTFKKDFWEYDPGTNQWTQKTDFGGMGRYAPVGFSIGAKGYIGTGF